MRLGTATLLALALAAPAAQAAKPKPPPCEAGRFVVEEAASPLVPGGAAIPDEVILADDGSLALSSGCPAVAAKQKGSKKGNRLSAKWTKKKGLCAGMAKTAALRATFDPTCNVLSGSFKSKGVKQAFRAVRRAETLGSPSLAPALDAPRHTTKALGPAGGDVLARAADGTRFRLAVPPGALAEEVAITLTPVTAIGGLPLEGGLVAAVDLQPSGVVFALPATLYLMPAGGVPEGPVAGFGWSGAANAFAVSPWWSDPQGRWLALGVEHFSGYGIGIPGPSQLDALEASLLALEALEANIEALITACSQSAGGCTAAQLEQILVFWYDLVVGPPLTAASDVAARIAAHVALVHWTAAVAAATPQVETSPGSGDLPQSLGGRRQTGLELDFANLHSSLIAYGEPACSGPVTDWKDWVRIPDEIRTRAAQLHQGAPEFETVFAPIPAYCVELRLVDLSFPETLAPDTSALPLSFRVVIEAPDEEIGVDGEVELTYSEGASGPEQVATDNLGFAELTVQRDPGAPVFVEVKLHAVETEIDQHGILHYFAVARAGDLVFEENLDPEPSPTLEPGSTSKQCVLVGVRPVAGQTVAFALEGPGSLSADSGVTALDPLFGAGRACVEYTAPDAPVAKDEPVRLRAELVFDGQTYQDELALHPRWVEIALQADVGAGLEDATNAILWVPDTGPFAIAATATGPGATADDPPVPQEGADLDAQGEAALLSLSGTGGADTLALATNAAGKAGFALTADDSTGATTHAVELRHDPQGSSDPAGVVLKRLPPVMALSLPGSVTAGTPVPFEVTATEGPNPAEGYHVELAVTGGSVGSDQGVTNADGEFATSATLAEGETLLGITATLRAEPEGEALDVKTAEAVAGCGYPPDVLPGGSYLDSCEECTIAGTLLSCSCFPIVGDPQAAAIDVGGCREDEDIANIDGALACVPCED